MTTAGGIGRPARPLVIGHRGASATHPQNTVEAFVAAGRSGADGVELDVRASADGVLVVCHDERYPDGRSVAGVPVAQRPAHVPTLAEALDACRGMVVDVEIKHDPADEQRDLSRSVADHLVARTDDPAADRLVVSSFDARSLRVVRQERPELSTAALAFSVDSVGDWLDTAVADDHVAVVLWHELVDAELTAAAHDRGLGVWCWTVDDLSRAQTLARLGVDAVITNTPEILVGARSSW